MNPEAYLVEYTHKGVKYSSLHRYREDAEGYIRDNEIKSADIIPLHR